MKKLNCILLIDDNVHDNYFHSRVIEESDAANQVKTALTGDEAIAYLEKSKVHSPEYPKPDLIFLDINMPGMNGFEFLEEAKGKNLICTDKQTVVVMLTSSLNPNDEKTADEKFSTEIKDFLNKPLTKEALEGIIEKFYQ